MNIISIKKRTVDTDEVLLHAWSYDFYDMALSTE